MIKNDLYPHVFQPLRIRGLTLKNRLEYSPTVVLKCSPEGDVTQDVLTVEKGQRIFAGRAVLCFKPLAPAGRFLSPMARRAYRKGARHEN